MLTHFSLFTGIGGLDLAAEWAGFTTVGQCEWADYQTKVLEKHWPAVPRWRDIRDVTKQSVTDRGIGPITIVSGGFPCQPFSVAGKQKGKGDDRYLWPEMLRVIREFTPCWVVGENVPGILSIAADDVCKDMEREGYEVGIYNFEAAAVGARHRRERIFFVGQLVANPGHKQPQRWDTHEDRAKWTSFFKPTPYDLHVSNPDSTERRPKCGTCDRLAERPDSLSQWEKGAGRPQCNCENVSYSGSQGLQEPEQKWQYARSTPERDWWAVEPDVGRVANGIPHRVDRLKCLGNAVVPQQAYPIFKAIYDIEMGAYSNAHQ